MESMKLNKTDHEIVGGRFLEAGHSFNQVSKIHGVSCQVPPQYSNLQSNSLPGHYSRQIDVSVSKHHHFGPRPPVSCEPPVGSNVCISSAPSSHPCAVANMPFQNSNCQFRPYPPTVPPPVSSSAPLHMSVNLTQNNHRPLFNIPPPPVLPVGNIDPMRLGRFNFPPPPVPAFSHGYAKSELPLSSNHLQQHFNNSSGQTVFHSVPSLVSSQSSSYQPSTMSQIISDIQSTSTTANKSSISEKENLLANFLQKFNIKEKHEGKSDITVAEFQDGLKKCFSLFNLLQSSRRNLVSLLDSNQEIWKIELKRLKHLQDILSEACSVLSFPKNLTTVQRKLKAIQRKRALKKKLRASVLEQKIKKEQERARLHQEIDKWFDNLKEKNEKMKREIEMKKEADNILAEVRKKIHEAKKTIEKLKVLEKLRSARQANAVQKGLNLQLEHSVKFEAKISHLRETMLAQLSDYEQEEKALQVMLETEQEDRREEEALWRKRKLMTFQQKKQKAIVKSLFGDSEEPSQDDPLFLFYQYQNSGSKSIDNLIQIRHYWDIHLSDEGEPIPLQWVVPVPPSSSSWEECCTS